MNVLPQEKHEQILALLAEGKSHRFVASAVGVSRQTVRRRMNPIPAKPKAKRVGDHGCDWCGEPVGDKEFFRRTRRTSHKYCSDSCYHAALREKRDNDSCGRCGKRRKDLKNRNLFRGFCEGCYFLLRQYGFDSDAADAHQLYRILRKELSNVEGRKRKSRKHV